MPGNDESWAVAGLENDTAFVDRYPNPLYGRVAYTHGLELDRPLGVARFGYSHKVGSTTVSWSPFTVHPLWNVRGEAELGFLDAGEVVKCNPHPTNCVVVVWPFGALASTQLPIPTLAAWHGTVVEQKRDGTGTFYRRNRHYDPATGLFTQEDPIGLAGGLNLYGYANGDPVNFSDPFGLWPDWLDRFNAWQEASQARRFAEMERKFGMRPGQMQAMSNAAMLGVGATGGVSSAGGAFAKLAGPAQSIRQRVLQEFFGQGVEGAEARLASGTLSPGVTREMLEDYATNVARGIVDGTADILKQTQAAIAVQAARLKLIDEALRNWPK
jgi:RHS repeat-associated protein